MPIRSRCLFAYGGTLSPDVLRHGSGPYVQAHFADKLEINGLPSNPIWVSYFVRSHEARNARRYSAEEMSKSQAAGRTRRIARNRMLLRRSDALPSTRLH